MSDCCGKPLSIKDVKGKGEEFEYDDNDNLVVKKDASGKKTTFAYETRFKLPAEIRESDGNTLRFKYDAKGNLTFAKESTGSYVKLTYEDHGKIKNIIDHHDNMILFTYNTYGKPLKIEKRRKKKTVGRIDVVYNDNADITRIDYTPKNPEVVQDIRGTLTSYLRLLKPSGIDFEI